MTQASQNRDNAIIAEIGIASRYARKGEAGHLSALG